MSAVGPVLVRELAGHRAPAQAGAARPVRRGREAEVRGAATTTAVRRAASPARVRQGFRRGSAVRRALVLAPAPGIGRPEGRRALDPTHVRTAGGPPEPAGRVVTMAVHRADGSTAAPTHAALLRATPVLAPTTGHGRVRRSVMAVHGSTIDRDAVRHRARPVRVTPIAEAADPEEATRAAEFLAVRDATTIGPVVGGRPPVEAGAAGRSTMPRGPSRPLPNAVPPRCARPAVRGPCVPPDQRPDRHRPSSGSTKARSATLPSRRRLEPRACRGVRRVRPNRPNWILRQLHRSKLPRRVRARAGIASV